MIECSRIEGPIKKVLPSSVCCGQQGLDLAGDFLSCAGSSSELSACKAEEESIYP